MLTQHVLCPGGTDDDLGAQGGHTDLHTRVAILSKLTGQQLIQLGIEHAVCNELKSESNQGISKVCCSIHVGSSRHAADDAESHLALFADVDLVSHIDPTLGGPRCAYAERGLLRCGPQTFDTPAAVLGYTSNVV